MISDFLQQDQAISELSEESRTTAMFRIIQLLNCSKSTAQLRLHGIKTRDDSVDLVRTGNDVVAALRALLIQHFLRKMEKSIKKLQGSLFFSRIN
jgi:hypothetical protein